MRREHNTIQTTVSPTLWVEFNGNANDSSDNNYTPYYMNNRSLSYYNNMALIGQMYCAPYYNLDKFADTGDFSWYFRVYSTQVVSNGLSFLVYTKNARDTGDREYIAFNGGQFWFFAKVNNIDSGVQLNIYPNLNDWQEILIVRKNGVLSAYEDGILKYSGNENRNLFTSSHPYYVIGNSWTTWNDRYFRGYIDEIKYWHNTAVI